MTASFQDQIMEAASSNPVYGGSINICALCHAINPNLTFQPHPDPDVKGVLCPRCYFDVHPPSPKERAKKSQLEAERQNSASISEIVVKPLTQQEQAPPTLMLKPVQKIIPKPKPQSMKQEPAKKCAECGSKRTSKWRNLRDVKTEEITGYICTACYVRLRRSKIKAQTVKTKPKARQRKAPYPKQKVELTADFFTKLFASQNVLLRKQQTLILRELAALDRRKQWLLDGAEALTHCISKRVI